MQEVFEKIIAILENAAREAEKNMELSDNYAEAMAWGGRQDGYENAIEIVKQAAAEYNKDKYFNLDHATLHKCPKCGTYAEHRVNRKGLWACGCFECNLFKTAYDHGKAIEDWENFCAKYNNGWIPCEKEMPPIPEGWI